MKLTIPGTCKVKIVEEDYFGESTLVVKNHNDAEVFRVSFPNGAEFDFK